jgi:hypothetical protein
MASEPNPVELDAILAARKISRRVELLERARGKETWISVLGGVLLLGLLWWSAQTMGGPQVASAIFFAFCVAGWVENRLSRRLDAIVKLMEEQRESVGG